MGMDMGTGEAPAGVRVALGPSPPRFTKPLRPECCKMCLSGWAQHHLTLLKRSRPAGLARWLSVSL